MNIIEFKEKVYHRIVSQYMNDVRKEKLTWEDYVVIPGIFAVSTAVLSLGIFYSQVFNNYFYQVFILMVGIISVGVFSLSLFHLLITLKSFFNFKKQSDKFWGTTLLPLPILDYCDLKNFLKKTDLINFKKDYTKEEIDNLVMFTPDELEEMKTISFNQEQKTYLVKEIKEGHSIDFYCLQMLISVSDENITKENQLKKEQEKERMNNHKFILDAIRHEKEVEMEMDQTTPLKQKFKHLL